MLFITCWSFVGVLRRMALGLFISGLKSPTGIKHILSYHCLSNKNE